MDARFLYKFDHINIRDIRTVYDNPTTKLGIKRLLNLYLLTTYILAGDLILHYLFILCLEGENQFLTKGTHEYLVSDLL